MDGLVYLDKECLEHSTLSWETVLLNFEGDVKIGKSIAESQEHHLTTFVAAYQDFCRKVNPDNKSWAVSKIGYIARGLINKDENPVGILRSQWLTHPEAISFVAATTSARSVTELREVLYSKLSHLRSPELTVFSISFWLSTEERIVHGINARF